MRVLFFTTLFLCLTALQLIADPIEFKSKISDVVVYRSGVRITREAKVNLPAGQTEIVFSNLTMQINAHSLQVQVPEGIDLVAAQYKTNFIKNIDLPENVKKIKEETETLYDAMDWNNKQLAVYTSEEKILAIKLAELSSHEKGLSLVDLKEFTIYYRERSLDIKKNLFDIGIENKKMKARLTELQTEMNAINAKKNLQTGEVVFIFQSNVSRQFDLNFSYISNQAGWEPIYDLKAKDTHSPLVLNLKANVHQNTGIDWEQVKMGVSTGNPLVGNNRPILRPKYISFAPTHQSIAVQPSYNTAYEMMDMEEEKSAESGAYIQPAAISDTEITREYAINQHQTIPSAGIKRLVQLQRYDIEAKFQHHSVPKMDQAAFLLAQIPNWGQYNLLPGTANLYFQDTYIGQSNINSNVTSANILLSLGRDESIKIKRERSNYLEEAKFLGPNVTQNFEYTISVKNNKNRPVNLEILDQIPISQHEQIVIELKKDSGATYDEKTGGLKWEFELKAGASRELVFKYSQKSPKNKAVVVR